MRKSSLLLLVPFLVVGFVTVRMTSENNPASLKAPTSLAHAELETSVRSSELVLPEPSVPQPILLATTNADAGDANAMAPHVCQEAELQARVAKLESAVAELQARNAELEKQLLIQQYPADTPYGNFLRLPDADVLAGHDERVWIRDALLDDLPVMLQPGEAEWIYEQYANGGWRNWSVDDVFEAKVRLLSVHHNLATELPPDKAKWLDEYEHSDG